MSLLSRLPRFRGLFGNVPSRGLRLSILALCASVAPAVHAQVKVMTNGDSITFGVGASDPATQSYTAQLSRQLGSAYYTQKDGTGGATLLKLGTVPFWNTQGIRITSEMNPNVIYIMLGTNDSKPVNWIYKDQFVPDYLSLIDIYRALPAKPQIYLGLPPPATDSTGDVRGPVVANEVIPRIIEAARQRNLKVVDAHSPFLDPFRSLLPDGIHPNDAGHGVIATQVYNAIVNGRAWSPTPSLWQRVDIGSTGHAGADAVDESNIFQVLGGGITVGSNADAGRFVHQTINGDLELTARVLGQRNLDPLVGTRADSVAGVMVRESNSADSRQVSVLATPGAGVSFRWRDAGGATGGSTTVANVVPPVWVRVRRVGNTFAGFYSSNGSTWNQIGASRSVAMSSASRAGLVANSALGSTLSHARIGNVTLSGTVTGGTGSTTDSGSGGSGTGSTGDTGSTGGSTGGTTTTPTSPAATVVTAVFDPSAAASRTLTNNAYAALFDPAQSGWRFTGDTASYRPTLGIFPSSTREAAGFDGLRTLIGPKSQDLFTPGQSQDLGFVGAVRIPATGGSGKALILSINKTDTEPALGLGYDYGSGRFFAAFTQAFNGAPSEVYGPVAARGATYVLRLQKTGGTVRLRVDGALAAETTTARATILASGQGAPIALGGVRALNPQFVGQLGKFHLRNGTLGDVEAGNLEADVRNWIGGGSIGTGGTTGGTTDGSTGGTTGGTDGSGSTGSTSGGSTTATSGLDPAAANCRTITDGAFAALFDPALPIWRFTADVAANRPLLANFPGTARESVSFDGLRTLVGPRSQDLFTAGVSQDMGFVGVVRIPATGGGGRAHLVCINKNDTEPAVGLGYDYSTGRFFVSFTQAFNGAPSEMYGPVSPRGATYVVRLQKTGGQVRLRIGGVLAAEVNSARPAILAAGQGAPIALGGLRPLNPQFVGQLGKFHLYNKALTDTEAATRETELRAWLAGTN
jgi:acyl-CoA thioesterase I